MHPFGPSAAPGLPQSPRLPKRPNAPHVLWQSAALRALHLRLGYWPVVAPLISDECCGKPVLLLVPNRKSTAETVCPADEPRSGRKLAATGRLQAASSSSHAGLRLEAGRGCPKAYQLLTVSSAPSRLINWSPAAVSKCSSTAAIRSAQQQPQGSAVGFPCSVAPDGEDRKRLAKGVLGHVLQQARHLSSAGRALALLMGLPDCHGLMATAALDPRVQASASPSAVPEAAIMTQPTSRDME